MADTPYTFNKLGDGNVEVLQNGTRISTGTESAASAYGYAPAPTPAPTTTTSTSGVVLKSDGTTDYAASLEKIKANALELQKKASQLSGQNATTVTNSGTTGASSVVSSSAPVVAEEKKTLSDLNNLTSDNNTITQAHNDYLTQLDAEFAALEARREREVAGINTAFDTKRTQTEQAQKGEVGTFTSTLARIGGYLGDSASAAGAMVNLNQAHKFQLNDLEAKRQSAIQEAKNAIDDKKFALARLKAQEAKDYAKEISDSKQKFFENNLRILNEQRQQDEANRAVIKDKLANLAFIDPSKISSETKKEIDDFYGTPGFTDGYLNVTAASAKAKSQKDILAVQKDLLGLLQDIPAGQKVKFPDGTEYTGIGKTSDITTFQETDASGYVRLFTYNKGTGQVTSQNLGIVGKPSSDTVDKNNPRIVQASSAMEQLVDPKTGYLPVNAYIEMYRAYVKENNGKGQEFIQNFDPLIWTGRDKDFLVKQTGTTSTEEEE
jgi:hypothetical protein